MKKILLVIVLMLISITLIGCEEVPHEECVTEWTLKIEDRPLFIISTTTYVMETEYGDVVISKKIYETAQENGYKEVCLMVQKGEETTLIGATRIDGTPEENEIIDEITEQIIDEEGETTNE